jgi:hypothetical protein
MDSTRIDIDRVLLDFFYEKKAQSREYKEFLRNCNPNEYITINF